MTILCGLVYTGPRVKHPHLDHENIGDSRALLLEPGDPSRMLWVVAPDRATVIRVSSMWPHVNPTTPNKATPAEVARADFLLPRDVLALVVYLTDIFGAPSCVNN